MNRIVNFLLGAGNVLCLFPQASRIEYADLISTPPRYDSVSSALDADWAKVGAAIQAAIDNHEREVFWQTER